MKLNIDGRKCCGSSGCGSSCGKLDTFDYLSALPQGSTVEDFVEVQFKNTRKGFYLNNLHLPLFKGDVVAVEASPGHDIGTVTLTGKMVELQMRRCNYHIPVDTEPKKIYRIARPSDIEKYEESKAKEEYTMIESRQIAKDLGLDMKIGDVEYQGDGQKAIFYYIADQRVDFRQLIKKLAEVFHIRIEMKQIGARQEAGRIGGLGPCGRQLCCSGWVSSFVSVGTNAARIQDLSLNPQKLAGQCAKLKCCLNYEVDVYHEAQHKLPSKEIELRTQSGNFRLFKSDILSGMMTYIPNDPKASLDDLVTVHSSRVFEVIRMNKEGEKPFNLLHDHESEAPETSSRKSKDILSDESLTRFDVPKEGRPSKKKRRNQDAQAPRNRNTNEAPVQGRDNRDRGNRRRPNRAQQERQQKRAEGKPQRNDAVRSEAGGERKSIIVERVKASAENGARRRRQPRRRPQSEGLKEGEHAQRPNGEKKQ